VVQLTQLCFSGISAQHNREVPPAAGTTRFPGSAYMPAGTAQDPVLPRILPGQ